MKKKNLIHMEPLHATEGCRTETYIRQNFPDENTVLCSNMRGTLNLGFAKVLTVNDLDHAKKILEHYREKNQDGWRYLQPLH